jgi:energy-coupling factor transport system ATP-binding protein
MQHLNGLLRPQEGTVHIAGHDLGDAKTDLRAIRRMAGLVFQRPEVQIFEQYVGDEIAYGPRLAGLTGEELRSRVRWAMDLVGLDFEGFKDRMTFALSGGEQRKVALASTLALRPRVLLLDEPTAGLDPRSRAELLEQLNRLRKTGMTLLLASHEMTDITALTQHITVMDHGTSQHTGSTAEVFADRERLQTWGLEQPVVTQVAEGLRTRGWPLAAGIVDAEHLSQALAHELTAAMLGPRR